MKDDDDEEAAYSQNPHGETDIGDDCNYVDSKSNKAISILYF